MVNKVYKEFGRVPMNIMCIYVYLCLSWFLISFQNLQTPLHRKFTAYSK